MLERQLDHGYHCHDIQQLWPKWCCAGPEAWLSYFRMFDESRFVHVTSLDFVFLTLLAPFWVLNDASKRQWSQRCSLT